MEKRNRSIDQIKRRVYISALSIGIFVIPLLYWLFSEDGTLTSFDKILYPILFVLVGISFITFITIGKRTIAIHENFWFFIVFMFFLAQFSYLLSKFSVGLVDNMGDYVIWISVLYLLAFIMFPSRLAMLWSLTFLGATFIIGVYYSYIGRGSQSFPREISLLIQIYASSTIYIVLLNAYAILKNQYLLAELRADYMTSVANIDSLTGVYSRAKLRDILEQIFSSVHLSNTTLSVIMLDVDKLKSVNDRYGHNRGDYLLQQIAKILQKNLRDSDLLGRWGGDEFLLICPETDHGSVQLLATRLTEAVSKTEISEIGYVSISSGVASYQPGDTLGTIINRADQLMYESKTTDIDYQPTKNETIKTSPLEHSDNIRIEPATPKYNKIAAELILQTFENTADYLFGMGIHEKAQSVMSDLFQQTNNRYSYVFTDLLHFNGEVIGLLLSYPGPIIPKLSWPMFIQMSKILAPLDLIRFLIRSLQYIDFKESNRDEYFINNVVVIPKYRGNGYGKILLDHAEDKAIKGGFNKLSLNVNVDNVHAMQIYNWIGYKAIDGEKKIIKEQAGDRFITQKMVKDLSISSN